MKTLTHTARTTRTPLRALFGLVVLFVLAGCASKAIPGHPSTVGTPPQHAPGSTDGPSRAPQGLPSDWSAQAIRAATASLKTCAQADSLQPPNCPQQIQGNGPDVLAVHWTVLNEPLDHAVAVPVQQADQSGGSSFAGQVAVYGLYQMDVSYTTAGQSVRPYLDYAGGIAEATMTWDGQSFQNVVFKPGHVLPAGVTIPPLRRPSDVSDAAVLQAVQSGFHDCVTINVTPSMTTPPNCPNRGPALDPYFVNLRWSLNSDPMQGALVSFDTDHGNLAVTGSFTMTLNTVRQVPGQAGEAQTYKTAANYTATLAWDGQHLTLLNIAAI